MAVAVRKYWQNSVFLPYMRLLNSYITGFKVLNHPLQQRQSQVLFLDFSKSAELPTLIFKKQRMKFLTGQTKAMWNYLVKKINENWNKWHSDQLSYRIQIHIPRRMDNKWLKTGKSTPKESGDTEGRKFEEKKIEKKKKDSKIMQPKYTANNVAF